MKNYFTKILAIILLAGIVIGCKKDDGNKQDLKVQTIKFSNNTLEMFVGDNKTITAEVLPANAKNKSLAWISSDNSIATVSEGKVTAIKVGECTITATAKDGSNIKAECKVTVSESSTNVDIKLSTEKLSIFIDKTEQLEATVTPNDAKISWESSNEDIAKVDETGLITAVGVGTATITAKVGESNAKCEVEVKASIYIIGSFNYDTALLWENGKEIELPDSGIAAMPNDVAVSDKGDVYIVGYDTKDDTGIISPVYWKNGEMNFLENELDKKKDVTAKSIFIKGEDVYITGYQIGTKNKVYLWKNGKQTTLPSSNNYAEANSVFVTDNNDVYVVGYDEAPAVWKNGERIDAEGGNTASLQAVFAKGDKVYFAGQITDDSDVDNPGYWENNKHIALNKGEFPGASMYALGLYVDDNNNIYVVGSSAGSTDLGAPKQALYWKNGNLIELEERGTRAADICVYNNKAYVVGHKGSAMQKLAALWIDGKAQELTTMPKTEARGIFIRK